jgi:hypothetical protein
MESLQTESGRFDGISLKGECSSERGKNDSGDYAGKLARCQRELSTFARLAE